MKGGNIVAVRIVLASLGHVTSPLRFLKAVDSLRRQFERDPATPVDPRHLRMRGFPPSICAAAADALVNQKVLRWTDDGKLIRADVKVKTKQRRTA